MKTYFLLRDNKETGPFELHTIRSLNLKPYDLIWVENESKGWKYPEEIEELAAFVCKNNKPDAFSEKEKNNAKSHHGKPKIYVSLPTAYSHTSQSSNFKNKQPADLEVKYSKSLDEIKALYIEHISNKKPVFKNNFKKSNTLWLLMLLGSLIVGAVTIKKVVDGMDADRYQSNNIAALQVDDHQPVVSSLPIATEAIAVDTIQEEKPKVKKINLAKLVKIEKNDFTVGVFGGINNLKLTLYNHSPYELDKVDILIEYLRPNGDIISNEKMEVYSINPGNFKTIKVPASKRGVNVRTKVLKVSSKNYKAALLQL